MSRVGSLAVNQGEEDRYARTTLTSVKNKKATTPAGCIAIRTKRDLESYIDFKLTYRAPSIGFVTTQLYNAAETTAVLVTSNMRNYTSYYDNTISQFLDNSIIMVEPATEFPFYDPMTKLKKIEESAFVPPLIRRLVRETIDKKKELEKKDKGTYKKWRIAHYREFWEKIDKDAKLRVELIRGMFRSETVTGGDYGLPPVPVSNDSNTLRITERINDFGKHLWSGKAPCATYFIFAPDILEDFSLLDGVIEYLKAIVPSDSDPDIIVFKFKEADFTAPEARLNHRRGYRYLLEKIVLLKKENPNRLFILLEAGHQLYPSMVAGFDVVSTSFTGYDRDSEFGRGSGWGSYYDRKLMIHIKHDSSLNLKKLCLCPVCEGVTDINALTRDYWNFRVCRPHFGLTLNDMASEIKKLIADKNIQEARGRLEKSELSILKSLIPTF